MDGWVSKWVNVRVIGYLPILYQLYLNFIGTVYLNGLGRKRYSCLSRYPDHHLERLWNKTKTLELSVFRPNFHPVRQKYVRSVPA
jgi:hypothetical protein